MKNIFAIFSIMIMVGTLHASGEIDINKSRDNTLSSLDKNSLEVTTKELMKKSISLLKAGEIKKTLILLVHPQEMQRRGIVIDDKFVEKFKKNQAEKLLILLEEALTLKPNYISNKKVEYKLKRNYLNFIKYNGKWYLSNHKGKIREK